MAEDITHHEEDITHHEEDIDDVLASLGVRDEVRQDVARYFRDHLWDREAVLAASRPFEGVFGVIRWFQLQPWTHVALNTGGPHRMREDTLESLNTIGAAYRVRFDHHLLFTADVSADVPPRSMPWKARAPGASGGRGRGQRTREPASDGGEADPDGEILFLHADTIFRSQRDHQDRIPATVPAGRAGARTRSCRGGSGFVGTG